MGTEIFIYDLKQNQKLNILSMLCHDRNIISTHSVFLGLQPDFLSRSTSINVFSVNGGRYKFNKQFNTQIFHFFYPLVYFMTQGFCKVYRYVKIQKMESRVLLYITKKSGVKYRVWKYLFHPVLPWIFETDTDGMCYL